MARPRISDLPLTYIGQVEATRIPVKWLHPETGKAFLLSTQERHTTTTYAYHAPARLSETSVREWAMGAFPFGCSIVVVHSTTINRRK